MIRINLKENLKKQGKTMSDLSAETGISRATLSLLSSGKSQGIQFKTLESIMQNLGLGTDELPKLIKLEYKVPELKVSSAFYADNLINMFISSISKPVYHFQLRFYCRPIDDSTLSINGLRQEDISPIQGRNNFITQFSLEPIFESLLQSSVMFPNLLLSLTPEEFNKKIAPLIIQVITPLYKKSSCTNSFNKVIITTSFTDKLISQSSIFNIDNDTIHKYSRKNYRLNMDILRVKMAYNLTAEKNLSFISGDLVAPINIASKKREWHKII